MFMYTATEAAIAERSIPESEISVLSFDELEVRTTRITNNGSLAQRLYMPDMV